MAVSPDQFSREALGEIGASGNPTFEWKLTSSSLKDQVKLVVQDKVLPIIFVPGIMGSNLMDRDGNPVWRLDGGFLGAPWQLIFGVAPKGPGGRQRVMHPNRTQVDPGGKVPSQASGTVTGKNKRDRRAIFRDQRFWGEVGSESYHDYLVWLEDTLNGNGVNPASWPNFTYKNPMMSATPRAGQARPEPKLMKGQPMVVREMPKGRNEKEIVDLTSDDMIKRAGMRMPVYACGYNWLESNDNAADLLRERVQHVIAKESGRGTCNQVLLITHSMGGLVARRCAQLSGMKDAIAGIVHGVMPATGAAVAYRRCKIGMRDEDFGPGLVIGSNGRETTAVFAQAPGALQLLPTEQYRRGWLKIKTDDGHDIRSIPKADPYSEIYLCRDRWWGLIREEWLSPADGEPIAWAVYERNIDKTRQFNVKIQGSYHSNTYVYYGADDSVPSYETVRWVMKRGLRDVEPDSRSTATQVADMGFSEVDDYGRNPLHVGYQIEIDVEATSYDISSYWELWAEQQDGGGDGTVPASSGESPMKHATSPNSIRQQYRLVGFKHEPSYRNDGAQLVTLHCINKIAAEASFSS